MIDLEKSGLNRFTSITTIASMKPVYCHDKDSIDAVIKKIIDSRHRSIPILGKNGSVSGIVTATDILNSFMTGMDFSKPISGIMVHDVLSVNSHDTIGYVLQKFKVSRRSRFPVLHDGKLAGIVSDFDIVKFFVDSSFGEKTENVMTRKPFFIQPSISIMNAVKTMVNSHYRRLPVVDSGKIAGLVIANDLLKILKERNYAFPALEDKISSVMIKNPITVKQTDDISAAIKTMMVHEIDGVLVSEDAKLEGILTERNILEQIN